jgi:ABC-type Fe3+ transport system permease subunit
MHEASPRSQVVQGSIAALIVLPLMAAFFGAGGFADTFGATRDVWAARQAELLDAGLRSLLLATLSTTIALAIGIPAGWALAQRKNPLWLLMLCALPLALPASVCVSGWVRFLAPGAASSFNPPAIIAGKISRGLLFSTVGAGVILGASLWPLIAFETWPALKRARTESYDAAVLAGSRLRAFCRIVIPQSKGELAAGALLAFLLSAGDFSVSSLLLIRTLPIEVHDALMLGKPASAAWAALPSTVLVLLAALALSRLSRSRHLHIASAAQQSPPTRNRLVIAITALGVAVGFGVPLLGCFWGVQNSGKSFSPTAVATDAMLTSLRVAGAVALLAVLLGILRVLAWPDRRSWPLNTAALCLLAIPGSFLAAAIFSLQMYAGRNAIATGSERLAQILPGAFLGLGLLVRFIYIPLRLVEEGLASLDREMLESAALAGHGRISRAIAVALPLILPHIAAASALVFILALGEVPLCDRLTPPGVTMATVWLFQQQHMGYDEAVLGLSLLMGSVCAGTLLVTGVFAALARKALRF